MFRRMSVSVPVWVAGSIHLSVSACVWCTDSLISHVKQIRQFFFFPVFFFYFFIHCRKYYCFCRTLCSLSVSTAHIDTPRDSRYTAG